MDQRRSLPCSLTVLALSGSIDTDFAYLDMEIDYESRLWFLDVPLYIPAGGRHR